MNYKLPYNEEVLTSEKYVRTFSSNLEAGDLVWHRDAETRLIKSINNSDWKIQLDNQLPKLINEWVTIPKGEWHRLIKGNSDLTIELIKIIE